MSGGSAITARSSSVLSNRSSSFVQSWVASSRCRIEPFDGKHQAYQSIGNPGRCTTSAGSAAPTGSGQQHTNRCKEKKRARRWSPGGCNEWPWPATWGHAAEPDTRSSTSQFPARTRTAPTNEAAESALGSQARRRRGCGRCGRTAMATMAVHSRNRARAPGADAQRQPPGCPAGGGRQRGKCSMPEEGVRPAKGCRRPRGAAGSDDQLLKAPCGR